ncbi:5669_t:CDS:1, partial [Funneliformis geosporum]
MVLGRRKLVAFPTTSLDINQDTSDDERISGSETNISSNSNNSFEDRKVIDICNINN